MFFFFLYFTIFHYLFISTNLSSLSGKYKEGLSIYEHNTKFYLGHFLTALRSDLTSLFLGFLFCDMGRIFIIQGL